MFPLRSIIRKSPIIASIVLLTTGNCYTQEFHGQNTKPVYPGGIVALREFISKNLNFPASAANNKIYGAVMVEFTVTRDGNVRGINLISGLDDEYDQEAIRVVSLLEGWEPAVNWGSPVDSKMRIPVIFRDELDKDNNRKNNISGIVMEKCSGLTLGGVLVRILDTNIGTLTGNDGRFVLEIPSGKHELEFSSIGYETKTVNVRNYRTLKTELDQKVYEIDFEQAGIR